MSGSANPMGSNTRSWRTTHFSHGFAITIASELVQKCRTTRTLLTVGKWPQSTFTMARNLRLAGMTSRRPQFEVLVEAYFRSQERSWRECLSSQARRKQITMVVFHQSYLQQLSCGLASRMWVAESL